MLQFLDSLERIDDLLDAAMNVSGEDDDDDDDNDDEQDKTCNYKMFIIN